MRTPTLGLFLIGVVACMGCGDSDSPADGNAGVGTAGNGTNPGGGSDGAGPPGGRDDGGSTAGGEARDGAVTTLPDAALCETEIVVCSDFVDDDCDGRDEPCPTTQSAVVVPSWDCTGQAPAGVVAVARFGPKDCVAFFESSAGAIYVAPLRAMPVGATSCPSFDERRYAYTLAGDQAACPGIDIDADFSENPELAVQPVSNACRKFLHPMSQPLTYVVGNRKALAARVATFGTLELACVGYRGWPYKWESLLQAKIELL